MINHLTNEEYTITIESPLLRPGITIKSGPMSSKYVVNTVKKMMDIVREINTKKDEA